MFTKNDRKWFLLSGLTLTGGLLCVGLDPVPNGFGVLTLWIAPPTLLAAFLLVLPGISGGHLRLISIKGMRSQPRKYLAALGTFATSLLMYSITLEPTASLWDCSEFIASAYKLQVPHTPGNPLLLLIGRVFSFFSFDDSQLVARCINMMSAVFSAATIAVVYFIIVHLAKRMGESEKSPVVIGAAISGSLCLAFSDTFWFSSVEAETYAASCFFLFLMVLLILKGAALEGEGRNRMFILISYIGGLSYCIHPMCVLALPVLPVVWYLQSRPLSLKNIAVAFATGICIVLFINRFIAVGIFEAAFGVDKWMVNGLGMPFYSGVIVLIGALVAVFHFLLRKFRQHSPYFFALIFLCAGFLPYVMMFIRSGHNPPIDESNPENLQLVKAYMNREGYPTRPLLFGPYFDAEVVDMRAKQTVYYKDVDAYSAAGTISEYEYEKGRQTILPRIYSTDPSHIATYERWTGLKPGEKPRFTHNIEFMLRYQLGHMYLRYLMFNFAGRESDEQNSSWLAPWQSFRTTKDQYTSKARNQYWMIPLLVGIIGIYFHYRYDKRGLMAIGTVFLMTGMFLVVYLNSTPNEPRERDYIYVGSYVAFALWIGLGFLGMMKLFQAKHVVAVLPFTLAIPALMAFENFDDHNRTGRTFQIDNAKNILDECAPGAMLFTGGDNDTFPLWYLQEVEGYRTDVRVVVLSYLNTDWYINQLRNHYYDSKPFRLTLDKEDYRQYGPNDVLYIHEQVKNSINAEKFLELLHQKHPALRVETRDGDFYNTVPSNKLFVPAKQSDPKSDTASGMSLKISEKYLAKNALAIVDLVINNPDRPFYFNFTSMTQAGLELENYLIQEGQLFRLDPSREANDGVIIDADLSFKNLVEQGNYKNLLRQDVYFSFEDHELRMINPLRQSFNSLAAGLVAEGENEKAIATLEMAIKYFYREPFRPSFANLQAANLLVRLGKEHEAEILARSLYTYNDHLITLGQNGEAEQQLRYYAGEILSSLDSTN
jgi:hypothetical protein